MDKHERKNISRMFFILGSIAPDIKIAKHPKFKIYNDSIDLIKSKMESLESLGKRRFSYRLGVISHYITDYFCLAHNLQNTLKT
ncbi:MAG: zinc dependent phospholipase C family protein, partial [Clostridiales bacterium]|nr:zinc dependent phospholipase C family protein [Clostridiales bacterium]